MPPPPRPDFGAIGRPIFGRPATPAERAPAQGRRPGSHLSKAVRRKMAALEAARDALAVLPGPGETLHALMIGEFDLMSLIVILCQLPGIPCRKLSIATLSYSPKNLTEIVGLLDTGHVQSLDLVTSHYFAGADKAVWQKTIAAFSTRPARCAAPRSHAKVVAFDFGPSGPPYTIEGSANLRTNKNREQFTLTNDTALRDFHAAWIDELVTAHAARTATDATS